MTCELIRPAEIPYRWLVNTRSLGINIRFHFAGKQGLGHEMTALFSATVDFILTFESLSVFKHVSVSNNISMLFCYSAIYFLMFFFLFLVKVVSTWISVSSLLLMLPIPRMPQQYQMRRLKLLIKSSVRQRPDLLSNSRSPQLWKCSVSTN